MDAINKKNDLDKSTNYCKVKVVEQTLCSKSFKNLKVEKCECKYVIILWKGKLHLAFHLKIKGNI